MAQIPPETKAAALVDLAGGMSYNKVAAKHGIGKGTVAEWAKELKKVDGNPLAVEIRETRVTETPSATEEIRRERLNQELLGVMLDSLLMLRSWAQICGDREFVLANPGGARELGEAVLDRADRLVSAIEVEKQPN